MIRDDYYINNIEKNIPINYNYISCGILLVIQKQKYYFKR